MVEHLVIMGVLVVVTAGVALSVFELKTMFAKIWKTKQKLRYDPSAD